MEIEIHSEHHCQFETSGLHVPTTMCGGVWKVTGVNAAHIQCAQKMMVLHRTMASAQRGPNVLLVCYGSWPLFCQKYDNLFGLSHFTLCHQSCPLFWLLPCAFMFENVGKRKDGTPGQWGREMLFSELLKLKLILSTSFWPISNIWLGFGRCCPFPPPQTLVILSPPPAAFSLSCNVSPASHQLKHRSRHLSLWILRSSFPTWNKMLIHSPLSLHPPAAVLRFCCCVWVWVCARTCPLIVCM